MKTNFDYNENSVRQIEYLLPRLKYSVLPTKIVKWLENFDVALSMLVAMAAAVIVGSIM